MENLDGPPSGHVRTFRRLLTVLVVVVCGLVFGAKPAWRWLRKMRAADVADSAERSWRKKEWRNSGELFADAQLLSPGYPPALRGLARYYAHARSPYALNFFALLESSGTAGREDRMDHVRAALAVRRTDIARRLMKGLLIDNPADPDVLTLLSETFEQVGDLERARAAARDALAVGATGARAEFRLASLELASPVPEESLHGKRALLALVVSAPSLRSEVALLLLERGTLTSDEAALLRRLVPKGPEATFGDRLFHLLADIRLRPADAVALVRRFAEVDMQEKAPPQLAYVADQLGRTGAHRAVVDLVTESLALHDPVLCRLRLGALLHLGDRAAMARLIETPDVPLPAAELAIVRAGYAQMSGDAIQADLLWRLALDAVAESPSSMEMLARHAETVGALDAAIAGWQGMLQDPVLVPRSAANILRLAGSLRPRPVLEALRRLAGLRPDRADIRLSLAYVQMLLKVDRADAEATLALGEGAFTDKQFYRIVSMLAALEADRADAAAQLLDGSGIEWEKTPPAWQAVRVATLARSGQNFAARQAAEALDPSRLSLPEQALVADLLPRRR